MDVVCIDNFHNEVKKVQMHKVVEGTLIDEVPGYLAVMTDR